SAAGRHAKYTLTRSSRTRAVGAWAKSFIHSMSPTSRWSKTSPSLRQLNTLGSRQAAQSGRTGLEAAIVIIAEAGLLHAVEDRLHVILDPVQREFAIVGRECRPRIVVSRLPHRTRVAVCLSPAVTNELNVRVPRGKTVAGYPVEIRFRPLHVL